jgi:hypothetical protein
MLQYIYIYIYTYIYIFGGGFGFLRPEKMKIKEVGDVYHAAA